MAIKETLDDNVFLQDISAIGSRRSFVTALTPAVGFAYQEGARFKAALAYSADLVRYHSESGEDHAVHRGSLNLSGKRENLSWELLNSLQWIDGNDQGPDFPTGCDIPAAGGIPLRERRDALVYRGAVKLVWQGDQWLLRPVASRYDHDFRTQQRARTGAYLGYENYIDRSETAVGFDAGRKISAKGLWMTAGYRFGHQHQGKLLGVSSLYSNDFHRLLVGLEGPLSKWAKINLSAGPEFRQFATNPHPSFHGAEVLLYVDASVILSPTTVDTVTITARRFEQPGFASHSVYEDCTYELVWKRKFGAKLTLGAGLKTYITDFQAPSNREDWITTPAVTGTYVFSRHLSAEFGFLRDRARSRVPGTTARDYTRQLFNAGLKYTF